MFARRLLDVCLFDVCYALYPVYTIEQTSSWLVQLTYSQLVEPA